MSTRTWVAKVGQVGAKVGQVGWPPHPKETLISWGVSFPPLGEGELDSNSPFGRGVGVQLPSLGRRTKGGGAAPQALLSTYIYRGRAKERITTLSSVSLDRLKSSPILQILLPGLPAKPCRSFTSTSTTTPSCCWTLGGDLHHHLRCSLERGEEGRHRHRTRDRGRKCCRNAAPNRSTTSTTSLRS